MNSSLLYAVLIYALVTALSMEGDNRVLPGNEPMKPAAILSSIINP